MPVREDFGFGLLTRRVANSAQGLTLSGLCALKIGKSIKDIDIHKIRMDSAVGGDTIEGPPKNSGVKLEISGRSIPFIKGYRLHGYRVQIDYSDAYDMDMQNKQFLYYGDEILTDVNYDFLSRRAGGYRNSRIIRREGRAMFFRQTVNNKLWFTIRPEIIYDRSLHRFRLWAAWAISRLTPRSGTILMYEKEASRYEESASVLFEKLVEKGYTNVRYIIDEGNPAIKAMPAACKKQLITKNSFTHLLEFFRSYKFIGTETMDHSLQLRVANKHVFAKLRSDQVTYVFLQHGVMYMVSLDADMRGIFRGASKSNNRIVVSSEAEADHFVDLGGFDRKNLYVTGLAKFDKSYRYDDADHIMIMPTWRRWETNEARRDLENTGYYRMLLRMVKAVPENLKDKIIIMPHPLMRQLVEESDSGLAGYLRPDLSHDEALRMTRLLITDYSSIAYDAFYRGANVVFCWEDMEECMEHYGNAHLMLNEENAFGDVTRTDEERARAVMDNYRMDQSGEYVDKYRRIVTFHDNRNTERIIEKLKEDMII